MRRKKPKTLSDDNVLWLGRIIEDLDPEDFGSDELVETFATQSFGEMASRKDHDSERDVRKHLHELVLAGYVEKIARGRYRVTMDGTFVYENS